MRPFGGDSTRNELGDKCTTRKQGRTMIAQKIRSTTPRYPQTPKDGCKIRRTLGKMSMAPGAGGAERKGLQGINLGWLTRAVSGVVSGVVNRWRCVWGRVKMETGVT